MLKSMKFHPQRDQMDCGAACLAMIAEVYGKSYPVPYLREECFLTREGVSLLGITEAARKIGFEALTVKLTPGKLKNKEIPLPCILHWNQNHFVVLRKAPCAKKNDNIFSSMKWKIADPAHGFVSLSESRFLKSWLSDNEKGIALFLSPNEPFYETEPPVSNRLSFKYLFDYLKSFKWQFGGMFILLLLGSLISLIFPFLTQNLIDKGVNAKNLNFVTVILLAQLAVFFGSITIEIIRNRLLLFVGTMLSIRIISEFLEKLLKLPIRFFDTKMKGDFQQRIQDNERIEHFLTSQSLLTFFSIITFSVFFGVLWYYSFKILIIYLTITILSIIWSVFWLKKRKILDYFRFQERSANQESIYEILNGVTEMKLNQFADYKRKKWEGVQEKLFKLNIRILRLDQLQVSGFEFLNQLKNIVVTFIAATLVIKGNISLGMMMSISYIIGQMNSPVNQLVIFFRGLQDAKLSLERLNEVQNHEEEEKTEQIEFTRVNYHRPNKLDTSLQSGIKIDNLSFQYEGPHSPFVLKDINLHIPEGKVTAVVGASGSGKTTLMKLLLKFYPPTNGNIFYNNIIINDLSADSLRKNIGVVMQDGFIFSDTIERNIATGDENINPEKMRNSIQISHLEEFISNLPLKLNTKIGATGNGISGGQRQRILIARAIYKNPHYIFFDEATSALDAENEKKIHDSLQSFFKGKTVLIIAHRLSTVKNADQIIVLKNGQITEQGTHIQLVGSKGEYFNLVKNQLELGN
jgi:ATP-binding cassette subfamily B protein